MADNKFDKEQSDYYFQLAAQQYSKIDLYFYLGHCPYSQLNALCVAVKKGYLICRASIDQIEDNQIIWGSEVNGYFTVREEEIIHCHFSTKLVRMYTAPPNAMFLVFPIPQNIDFNQRRFSRRVKPEEDFLKNLHVWYGEMQGGDSESLPQLRWINLKMPEGELEELSSSGMRLYLAEKGAAAARIKINDTILLRGDFGTPGRPMMIYVLATVVRKVPDLDNEEQITVGCSFICWRKVEDTRNTSWLRCDPHEGIGAIAQWISRNFHHLQI